MAVVTFMSDFGTEDHYVAAVKSQIIKTDLLLNIIDISHDIKLFDLSHASFVISQVYRDFPPGTVHLLAVDSVGRRSDKYLAISVDNHYFVCPDNGLISLVTQVEPDEVVILEMAEAGKSTFPAKEVMAPAAARIASGTPLEKLGKKADQYIQLIGRQVKATKKEIAGNVIRVDHYGNLITNITRDDFEKIHELNEGRGFSIRVGRETFTRINRYFYQVDPGDCFLFFNSNDLLQIGINKGSASDLLGLNRDARIFIQYNQS